MWISLPCRECGIERVYPYKRSHRQLCGSCARSKNQVKYPEFLTVFHAALSRERISQEQACDQAGVDSTAIRRWASGANRPRRVVLQALADVLHSPELLNTLPTVIDRIRVTCPECHREWARPAFKALRVIKRHGPVPDSLYSMVETASYLCKSCSSRKNLQTWRAKMLKRGGYGRKFFSDRGRSAILSRSQEDRASAIAKATEALRGKRRNPAVRWRMSVAKLSPYPKGTFGICRVCRLIMYRVKPGITPIAHKRCMDAWRSENTTSFEQRIFPPRPEGRLPSSKDLGETYAMCVRHLLRGEDVGELSVGRGGDRHRGAGLAAEYYLMRDGVIRRIKRFVERLPTDGRGGKTLQRCSEHLVAAARDRGYHLEAGF